MAEINYQVRFERWVLAVRFGNLLREAIVLILIDTTSYYPAHHVQPWVDNSRDVSEPRLEAL